jgi:hypothetical protein
VKLRSCAIQLIAYGINEWGLRLFNWLFYSRNRKREIAHNRAVAEAALIEPVYTEGIPATFLITVRGDVKANEIAWFVTVIDKRISAMCAKDMERYEHQRLNGEIPIEPLLTDAKRVVMRDHSTGLRESHVFVMQWTPKVHYNVG